MTLLQVTKSKKRHLKDLKFELSRKRNDKNQGFKVYTKGINSRI